MGRALGLHCIGDRNMIIDMVTIAITIEEATLERLDRVLHARPSGRRTPSRSGLIRTAVGEYLDRRDRAQAEERDAAAFSTHRRRLARQAEALIREQAKP
jgi:metal-responsive CopG/Arc/MetJ family transcriptional regulator